MFANISGKFTSKPQNCNLGAIINSDCYLDTSLWSPSSSKMNSPSHPSESFFSTSNDSGRAMHNKYIVHRQLLSLLSNKSLICYLVNIVTLKIQRLNQWISPCLMCLEYANEIRCCSWASHSIGIYTWNIFVHLLKNVQRALTCWRETYYLLFSPCLFSCDVLWLPSKGKTRESIICKGSQVTAANTWFPCAIFYFIKIGPGKPTSDWQNKIPCCML